LGGFIGEGRKRRGGVLVLPVRYCHDHREVKPILTRGRPIGGFPTVKDPSKALEGRIQRRGNFPTFRITPSADELPPASFNSSQLSIQIFARKPRAVYQYQSEEGSGIQLIAHSPDHKPDIRGTTPTALCTSYRRPTSSGVRIRCPCRWRP